jgi:hypothetical protein
LLLSSPLLLLLLLLFSPMLRREARTSLTESSFA